MPPSLRDHDYYAVFVINERTRTVAQDMWGRSQGRPLSRGWDGRYHEAAKTYRWLAPAASTQTSTGWRDAGTNIGFGPEALASPIEFVALVDTFGPPAKAKHITVGLAAWDVDEELAWAAVIPQGPAAPTTTRLTAADLGYQSRSSRVAETTATSMTRSRLMPCWPSEEFTSSSARATASAGVVRGET